MLTDMVRASWRNATTPLQMLFGFTCNGEREMPECRSTDMHLILLLLPHTCSVLSSKRRQRVIDISDVKFTFIKAHDLLSHIQPYKALSKTHGLHKNSSSLYQMLCVNCILSLKCFSVKDVIHDALRSELEWWGRVLFLTSCAFVLQVP